MEACSRIENPSPPLTESTQPFESKFALVFLLQGVCPRGSDRLKYLENIAAFSVQQALSAKQESRSWGYLTMKEEKSPRVNVTCKGQFISVKNQALQAHYRNIGTEVSVMRRKPNFVELLQVPHSVCTIKYCYI